VAGRFETVRVSVAYQEANVRIVGTHSGIGVGDDGYSQMALEDIAGLRALQQQSPVIRDVRGRGLMIGFDLVDHDMAVAFERACFERGVLTLTCGRRGVRLAPPLVVTEAQCDTALAVLADACHAVA
jgi:4-aminobutyrate aminotransferase-like enzyme